MYSDNSFPNETSLETFEQHHHHAATINPNGNMIEIKVFYKTL